MIRKRNNMIFSKKYYIGEKVRNKKMIAKRIAHNHPYKNIYCICVGSTSHHLMDIIESAELMKEIYLYKEYRIIGIANGKKEAFELTRKIIQSIYKEYGDPGKVKEFFALE